MTDLKAFQEFGARPWTPTLAVTITSKSRFL
jgi:hypothetical protein